MLSHYIDGEWIAGAGPEFSVVDPAIGREIWRGHAASPDDIDWACRAARAAFEAWAMCPLDERIAICMRFRDQLKANGEELALLAHLRPRPRAMSPRSTSGVPPRSE